MSNTETIPIPASKSEPMSHTEIPSNPAPAAPASPARASRAGARHLVRRLVHLEEFGITAVLVGLVALIGVFHPDSLSHSALIGTALAASFVALIAYGMVFLIAMTEIDLSVGSIFGFSALVSAELMAHGMSPWLALLTGPITGMALEAANGFVANTFRIPVIIVTLGTLTLYAGLATVVTNSQAVTGLPITSSFFKVVGGNVLGIPFAVWVVVVVGALLTVVFRRTPFGARVRAIGSNQTAARFSGIRVNRTRLQVLVLVGALAGLAGVLSLAYQEGADPTLGSGLELQVIAATIIGGTAVSGGSGTVPGALIGALIISVINGGLVFFSIGPNWSGVVTGATIVVAVSADGVLRRRRASRMARAGS
jgi:ribose transport system permease protein